MVVGTEDKQKGEELVQRLRELVALAEDSVQFPAQPSLTSIPEDLLPPVCTWHTYGELYTQAGKTLIYTNRTK